ncbi:MAG: phosphotransferase [Gammaproteobacteria bacterium]|nr:phosphotransferase [Gammaproteobacteria bacterium]
MKTESAALTAILAEAPSFATEVVARAIETQFGLAGDFSPLVSERDQNFLMQTGTGEKFVVKVTSGAQGAAATDFQIEALLHLEKAPDLRVPRVYRTLAGKASGHIGDGARTYRLRVVTWVDGDPLESQPLDIATSGTFGRALARLDAGLAAYSHPGENPPLLWDLQRLTELRNLTENITDLSVRERVAGVINDFEKRVLPIAETLRSQVIHADANPGNILLTDEGIGFIDFGDMMKAPLVFDVAIAASYLRVFGTEPLRFIVPFVTAYHSITPLKSLEADLLFDLVCARLAMTVTLLYWRLSARREDDPYRQKALADEAGAERYLALLDSLGRTAFRQKLDFIQ